MKIRLHKQVGEGTRLKEEAGFTLTEIMVVVGIIGLLVMVAVPNFLDWNSKARLKDGVSLLQGNMAMARMNAINQNTNVTVTLCYVNACPLVPAPNPVPSPSTVTAYFRGAGGDVLPPLTLNSDTLLTDASQDAINFGGLNAPQDVTFNTFGMRINLTTAASPNNLCITNSGAATACTNTAPPLFAQTFNFMNTKGLNYRIVVTTTGKTMWCYVSTCIQ